jgi:phenylpropionate dioxygenase-like ring-hydroxylating dioxygenase large terminal subunit
MAGRPTQNSKLLRHNIKMIERMLWHPVALSSEVAAAPLAVQLLGEAVVLWRSGPVNGHGRVQAWADKCPHRGAKLSLGRVQARPQGDSTLECAYHGWQFDGAGVCTLVPAVPAFTPPAGHCVKTFGVQEAYGLVWVQLDAARTALPLIGIGQDTHLRTVQCGPYAVATSAPRVVENFLDMAHFGFVHEGYLGARDAVAMADYTIERTLQGIKATGCRAWQPQSNVHAKRGAEVSYTYEVISPYCAVLTKVPDAGSTEIDGQAVEWRESIALWVCPITPETCRVWFSYAVADHESPDSVLQNFQNTIFAQDKPILESQTPARLPLDLRAEKHTVADKASNAYRRYLQDSGITFGVC